MYYYKTFDAMMATPLTVEEIITGEIIWGATKSLIATAIMMAVISCFGLIRYPEGLLLLPLAFLGGLAFGAAGMVCTALVPNIELFNLPVFLFITPMFLFGGTFFPLENLPLLDTADRRCSCRSPISSISPGPSAAAASTPPSSRGRATSPRSPRSFFRSRSAGCAAA